MRLGGPTSGRRFSSAATSVATIGPCCPIRGRSSDADVLLLESTYGNRVHPADDDGEALAEVIRATACRARRKLIIPSFAIGRVEEVLYWIKRLEAASRIPVTPVFVDSPMAQEALHLLRSAPRRARCRAPGRGAIVATCVFATRRFTVTQSGTESKQLTASNLPSIVISSSGMATGGRVLHHLARALPDPRNTVLFVGFQAEGTRGRAARGRRADGEDSRPRRSRGGDHRAARRMSAHADQSEILRWLGDFKRPPAHDLSGARRAGGDDDAEAGDRAEAGWRVDMPAMDETVTID